MPQNAAIFSLDFNPLHREGGDVSFISAVSSEREISIHSTARVETCPIPLFPESL